MEPANDEKIAVLKELIEVCDSCRTGYDFAAKDIDDEKTPCVIIHVNKSTFLVIDESAIREISRVDDINQLDENILARSKFFMSEKEGR